MSEEKEVSEFKERSEMMDKIFEMNSKVIVKEVEKIVGRDLTDEERKKIVGSLKAYFILSFLMINGLI